MRPTIPDDCPEVLADLMRRCWKKKPEERPSMKEISSIILNLDTRKQSTGTLSRKADDKVN